MNLGELVTVKTIERKNTLGEKPTPYNAEIRLLSCVQLGDIESLITQLKNLDSLIVMGRMSDDELTQHKYIAVSIITLATRYAIQGGLNENKAYKFSDRVIRTIDKFTDKNEILMCVGLEIEKLTQAVKKNKQQPEFSPHIRNCIKYINENLSEKISVTSAADYCGISADYLSQIFKKEIGENLSAYILRQKLEKAKTLLLKGMTSKEICIEVGFSSQAYFVTVFKRFYNMTPSEYMKITRSNT